MRPAHENSLWFTAHISGIRRFRVVSLDIQCLPIQVHQNLAAGNQWIGLFQFFQVDFFCPLHLYQVNLTAQAPKLGLVGGTETTNKGSELKLVGNF